MTSYICTLAGASHMLCAQSGASGMYKPVDAISLYWSIHRVKAKQSMKHHSK